MLYYTSPYGTTDTLSDLDDMLGEEVSCNLNPIGKIAAIRSGSAGDSGKIYGVVNDDDVQTLVNGQLTDALEVLKADGSLATYAPDSDSEYYTADDWETLTDTVIGTTVLRGDFVEISLNSDGYIDQLKHNTAITDNKVIAAGTDVTGDQDTDVITIGSDSYDASDTVIFDLTTGSDDYELGSLPDFMDKIDDADLSFTTATIAKLKDGEVKYLLLKDSALISTDVKLAMIAKTGVDSEGDYVYLLLSDGSTQKYSCDTDEEGFVKNEVFSYELSSGDISNLGFNDYDLDGETELSIDDINNNVIEIDGVNYYVDSDTLYWDSTEDDPEAMEFIDLTEGDTVRIFRQDDSGAIEGIQLVD
jgi:hypothetical protein